MGAGEVTNVEEIACPLPPSICRDKMVLRLAHRCNGGKKTAYSGWAARSYRNKKMKMASGIISNLSF